MRLKQPCGMQARLRMALRGPSTIWRNYTRPETACRAISTWQKHGMPPAAHGLSAASSKLASLRENCAAAAAPVLAKPALIPVVPAGPVVARKLRPGEDTFVELSWVAPAQPVQASFFVQVVALDTAGAHPTFTSYLNQSAILSAAAIDTRCICLARLYGRGLGDRLRAERMELFLRALRLRHARSEGREGAPEGTSGVAVNSGHNG